jgi:uncharacterized protein
VSEPEAARLAGHPVAFNQIVTFAGLSVPGYSSRAMTLARTVVFAVALISAGYASAGRAGAAAGDEAEFESGQVVIETGKGPHVIDVEIARSAEERAQGLMNRDDLPADKGMLFVYPGEGPVSMWMRNTYISLDMLFIRGNGIIAAIQTDTLPLSTDLISPGMPVHAVLELRAGSAQRLGIETGDIVRHGTFTPDSPAAAQKTAPRKGMH